MERFRDKWVRVGCIGLLVVACVMEAVVAAWLLNLISPPRGQPAALPEVPGAAPTGVLQPTPSALPASSASPTSPLAPTPPPTSPPAPPMVTPTPSIEPAAVEPYCSALGQSPVHVRQDQPITIHWAWVATAASYVQDHLDTATVQVLLNGEEVRPETQSEIEYDSGAGMYSVTWSADVGTLAPGSHRLDYHARWGRQISDGWYTYGPGGQTEEQHEYCELIVE